MLELLDALYTLDAPGPQWAAGVARAIRPFLDRDRLGVFGMFYRCPDPCSLTLEADVPYDASDRLRALFCSGTLALPAVYVAEKYLGRAHSLGADLRGWSEIEPVKNGSIRAAGLADLLTVSATEIDGQGCAFLSFRKERSPLSDREHMELTCISRHLTAAHRLRRKLDGHARSPANVAAVLDQEGAVLHARDEATTAAARSALARATRTMMRARRADSTRRQPGGVDDWPSMVQQRWTLIDHFERDGKRYVLAVENVGAAPGFHRLSAREQQVLQLALQGRRAKEIAYELLIAHSTVRVLMSRMMQKIGCLSWDEVIERGKKFSNANGDDGAQAPKS